MNLQAFTQQLFCQAASFLNQIGLNRQSEILC